MQAQFIILLHILVNPLTLWVQWSTIKARLLDNNSILNDSVEPKPKTSASN